MTRAIAAAAAALLLVGCRDAVDLDAVRAMAKTAANSQASYDALAADYYGSCLRRERLDSISSGIPSAMKAVGTGFMIVGRAPAATGAPAGPTHPYPRGLAPDELRNEAPAVVAGLAGAAVIAAFDLRQFLGLVDRDDIGAVEAALSPEQRQALEARAATVAPARIYGCKQASVSSAEWRKTNDILLGYFVALGDLAGSAGGDDRYGIGALAAQLHKSEVIPGDPAPFANVVASVVRASFDAKRRGAIADFVNRGKPLVDDAVQRLAKAARDHYVKNQLRQERDSMELFLIENRKYARPGADAFAVYDYAKAWRDEEKAVDDREIAANAYVSSLEKLQAAHDGIVRAANANDLRTALAVAVAYSIDVRSDLEAIDKAFGKKN